MSLPTHRLSPPAPAPARLVNLPYIVLALMQATCICSALFRPDAPAHAPATAPALATAAAYAPGLLALAAWLRRCLAGNR